ncbi:SIR2 family NAD-dependent protein deacylase [Herbaspirillum robiniae]|uniref:SIR2 family NAD-dependent protein deacylase n=1 Tax=Herbaspirillum robiniae TaxID=2014887 RepID=UPI0009A17312|nr:SIR2 family protein [Herbaspirillum robiniae]
MADSKENQSASTNVSGASIDRIPGGGHLLTIRNALKNRHASVMIGSGFSTNADGGNKLPTWGPLVDSLLADLYAEENSRNAAKARLGGTSGMLRLTQEYETLRGRAQLDARLHELLPDAGVVTPGKLHTKLLSLAWTDVFTTNYDTLLERTIDNDRNTPNPAIDRRYQIVASPDGVPHSRRNGQPRIVKLHGTLRSGSQLIVTEEDYRRYPKDYAPFVNTVQQSMLENVFCLIGFSGDDPNFLAWTGWARDHLGDKAASIYLISLSPLSDGQRLILEKRKIFPIDISPWGKDENGDVSYKKALEEVLRYWELEPARDEIDWPYRRAVLPYSDVTVTDLAKWVETARLNRAEYPGWLVAPSKNRERLRNMSVLWRVSTAFEALESKLPNWVKYLILEEIRWIEDVYVIETDVDLDAKIVSLLKPSAETKTENTFGSQFAGLTEPTSKELINIEAALILVLLRKAREKNDKEQCDEWREELEKREKLLTPQLRCSILYDQVIACLGENDSAQARKLLASIEKLDGPNVDPYWLIRIGSVFGELGAATKGADFVIRGLQKIRKAIQSDGEITFLVSRRLWAEWVFRSFAPKTNLGRKNEPTIERNPKKWLPNPELQEQLDRLDRVETEAQEFRAQESKPVSQFKRRDNVERPNFLMDDARREIDIAERELSRNTIRIDSSSIPTFVCTPSLRNLEASNASRTYIRLIERTALPPFIGKNVFSSRNILSSFKVLSFVDDAEKYLKLFRRVGIGPDYTAPKALELHIVSALSHQSTYEIFNQLIQEVELIKPDSEFDDDSGKQISLRIDSASRAAFRLEEKDVERLCTLAMQLHQHPAFRKTRVYGEVIDWLFSRTLRLLSAEAIARYEPKLLSLSIEGGVDELPRYPWPDLVQYLPRRPFLSSTKEWAVVVDEILAEMARHVRQKADGSTQDRLSNCVRRLDWLYYRKCMTPMQEQYFAELLWANVPKNGVPQFKSFYSGAFVVWPKPVRRPPMKNIFMKHLLSEKLEDIENQREINGEMKATWSSPSEDFLISLQLSAQAEDVIQWTEDELIQVIEPIQEWWMREGARLLEAACEKPDSFTRDIMNSRLLLVSQVIHRVYAPNLSLATLQEYKLDSWIETFWNAGVMLDSPQVPLLFSGLYWWPALASKVVNQTIAIIQSHDDRAVVIYALIAALEWLKKQSQRTDDTNRLSAFLVDGILSGPEYLVEQKLNFIRELLVDGGSFHLFEQRNQLASNLYSTWSQLEPHNRSKQGRFDEAAKPLMRVAIAKTAIALGRRFPDITSDACWLAVIAAAKKDPLLIVRRLFGNSGESDGTALE